MTTQNEARSPWEEQQAPEPLEEFDSILLPGRTASQDPRVLGPYQQPLYSDASTRSLARRLKEQEEFRQMMSFNATYGNQRTAEYAW